MITKDFGFLILFEFYLLCFLMKTAVAIPLKKSRKRKINVFLRGICFGSYRFLFTKKHESFRFVLSVLKKDYLFFRYSSMAAAAFLPAPIARITVAAPVTASPPA